MNREKLEEVLIEEDFPAEGMSLDERDFCLELISNCKDIKEPENIDNIEPGKLVEMHLKKEQSKIHFNGSVHYILKGATENRCINGIVFKHNGNICVDTQVTRLKNLDGAKVYTMFDEFVIKNGNIISRRSHYNYDLSKKYEDEIKIKFGGIK